MAASLIAARHRIAPMTAADADLHTLHIRCGSDLQGKLGEAGFGGDFVEFADPFCTGPLRLLPEDEQIERILRLVPVATHNQRARGTLYVGAADDRDVPAEVLLEIVEESMSSEIYELNLYDRAIVDALTDHRGQQRSITPDHHRRSPAVSLRRSPGVCFHRLGRRCTRVLHQHKMEPSHTLGKGKLPVIDTH